MADDKHPSWHSCTVQDCVVIDSNSEHWFDAHMPCGACHADREDKRGEMMWHEESTTHFHESCLTRRANGERIVFNNESGRFEWEQ